MAKPTTRHCSRAGAKGNAWPCDPACRKADIADQSGPQLVKTSIWLSSNRARARLGWRRASTAWSQSPHFCSQDPWESTIARPHFPSMICQSHAFQNLCPMQSACMSTFWAFMLLHDPSSQEQLFAEARTCKADLGSPAHKKQFPSASKARAPFRGCSRIVCAYFVAPFQAAF